MAEERPQGSANAFAEDSLEQSEESMLWHYLTILRRRFWFILPVVVVFGTMGSIKAFRAPRIFAAKARILVERSVPQLMQFEEGLQNRYTWDPDFYQTQAELLRSRAVMETALEKPSLREMFETPTPDTEQKPSIKSEIRRTLLSVLGATPPPPPEPWERLRGQINAEHVPDTHFIEVKVYNTVPQRASLLANLAAEAFCEYHQRRRTEMLGEAFVLLQKEKEKAEKELARAEQALQEFSEQAQGVTVSVSDEDQPAIERLVTLSEQLTKVQLERIQLASEIAVMKESYDAEGDSMGVAEERLFALPVIQQDSALTAFRRDIAEAEKQAAALSQTYGQEHPLLKAAQAKIVVLREQFKKTLSQIIQSRENALKMLLGQESELQKTYEEQRRLAMDLTKESFQLTRLQSDVNRHRRLYDGLMERMREVDISSGLSKTNVQLVERASAPSFPLDAGRGRTVMMSIFMGLFLGVALALVFENLDDTIKTPEDLKTRTSSPLLGFVPSSKIEGMDSAKLTADSRLPTTVLLKRRLQSLIPGLAASGGIDPVEDKISDEERARMGTIVVAEPMSSVAEAFRNIRANLLYSMPAEEIRVVSFTSCRPQEGKTTTACNLALSVAQTGKRVLLIDGDLHRPAVHRTLATSNEAGLTSVLVGETAWKDALTKVSHEGQIIEHLDVMTAGPRTPNPSELLGSKKMKQLLEEVREEYEWVIVDTPPILFVSDAGILSVMCDGVVVVVRSGRSTRTLLNRTTEQLQNLHARIIGTILNNVIVSRMGRHYSTYYNYGYSQYARDYRRSYYGRDEETGQAPTDKKAAAADTARPAVSETKREDTAAASRKSADRQPAPVAGTETDTAAQAEPASSASAEAQESKLLAEQLTSELQQVRREREEALQAADRARQELQEAQARIDGISRQEQSAEELRKQLVQARREREEAQRAADKAQLELKTVQARFAEASQQKPHETDLQRELRDARQEAEDALEAADEVRQELEETQAKLADAARNNGMLSSRVAELERQLAGTSVEKPLETRQEAVMQDMRRKHWASRKNLKSGLREASLHIASGNAGAALRPLEEITEARPQDHRAWELRITALGELRDAEGLQKLLEQLKSADVHVAYLHALACGHLATVNGNLGGAKTYLDEALALAPRNLAVIEALTKVLIKLGRGDETKELVGAMLRIDPANPYGNYVRGSELAAAGKSRKAEKALRLSVRGKLIPEALNNLGWLLMQRGNWTESEKLIRQALSVGGDNALILDSLGEILMQTGRMAEARETIEKAISLEPNSPIPRLLQAELLAMRGNTGEAREILKRIQGENRLREPYAGRLQDLSRKLAGS